LSFDGTKNLKLKEDFRTVLFEPSAPQCQDSISAAVTTPSTKNLILKTKKENSWAIKKFSALTRRAVRCHPKRVPANNLDLIIWDKIREALSEDAVAGKIIEIARKEHKGRNYNSELDQLRSRIKNASLQLELLGERLGPMEKEASHDKLSRILSSVAEFTEVVASTGGDPQAGELRTKIIQMLIRRIEVFPSMVRIYLYTDKIVPIENPLDPALQTAA